MTVERRPLLAFGAPEVGVRPSQKQRRLPRLVTPGAKRQGERLAPQFQILKNAFAAERVRLTTDTPDEVDPALVVVFDLAGTVKDFRNAVDKIEGLEFLSELLGERSEPDDDFHMSTRDMGRTDKSVSHSLYLMMSNAKAIDELLRLFSSWQADPSAKFAHGLGKFKNAFAQLTAIRRWGPEDRIRETGLLNRWREKLNMIGNSVSPVLVEVELWYRRDPSVRAAAEEHVQQVITASGGQVLDRSQIGEIGYHAILAELPIQQVQTVVAQGANTIQLLTTDDVMFVSPFAPMTVTSSSLEPVTTTSLTAEDRPQGQPRIALLDGLPMANHTALAGRIILDDPDELGRNYAVAECHHGTSMASLIIHGDFSDDPCPLDRPIYVRPIMQPHEFVSGIEQVLPNRLFPDLLHRAIRRIVAGEGNQPAAAPSVRIVNLSIGSQTQALTRRMSPVGRLLDWLASTYNLLFVVSAGNHNEGFTIPANVVGDSNAATMAATKAAFGNSLLHGVFPPGDAMNALTVGATHSDALGPIAIPDTVWDITRPDAPAHYSAVGPGVDRSVKPDIHHRGGRALYIRPVVHPGDTEVTTRLADTTVRGPGLEVAAPGRSGAMDSTIFTTGTSNATALVTREASRLFDILEEGNPDLEGFPFPDPQYHPLLVRALLVHSSSWGDWQSSLRGDLGLNGMDVRRQLTAQLGYGRLDVNRLGMAATNRAVLLAGGTIARDDQYTYELPLPLSLRAKAEWHRFTITLAFMAPTVGELNRYRSAKVYFTTPDLDLLGGGRAEAEYNAARRGSLQHEIVEGQRAMSFLDGDVFPIRVECMDDAQRLGAGKTIRYALVVSAETAEETSNTIHQEIRDRLRVHARLRARSQVQS